MGVIAKGISRGCQGLSTPVSLGYPLSVFNNNSTLKHVHASFILNNGKLSPRRATALVALEMIDPKKNPFNCTYKKDVW